jgi:hypothetical protein
MVSARSLWINHRKTLLGLVVLLILIYPLGPYAFSLCWRSYYGKRIDFAGISVPVPVGWFGLHRPPGFSVVRATPARIPFTYDFERISFRALNQGRGSEEQTAARWASDDAAEQIWKQSRIASTKTIFIDDMPVLCRAAAASAGGDPLAVCIIDNQFLVVFWGSNEGLARFYELLQACHLL